MLKKNTRWCVAVVVVSSMVSCSTVSDEGAILTYPQDWGELLPTLGPGCLLIDGVFENRGKTSGHADYPITLDGAVFGKSPLRGATAQVILNYNESESVLSIQYRGAGVDESHPSSALYLEAVCTDGGVRIDQSDSGYVDGTFSKIKKYLHLSRTTEGALSVKVNFESESSSLGMTKETTRAKVWYSFSDADNGE